MTHVDKKLFSRGAIIFDILLTIVFFVFMTKVLMSHVPASTTGMQFLFGAYGASAMSGVFWMAISLFRATRVDYARRRKARKS